MITTALTNYDKPLSAYCPGKFLDSLGSFRLITGTKLAANIPIQPQYFNFSLIDLTDYSRSPNGLVFVQDSSSSLLHSTTEYKFVIGSKINKKQFRVGEYWDITFICTRHAKIR